MIRRRTVRLVALALLVLFFGVVWKVSSPTWLRPADDKPVQNVTPAALPDANASLPDVAPLSADSQAADTLKLHRTVAEYGRPGRMIFLDFDLGPQGMRLVEAHGAEGRAKIGPPRRGPGLIHYEIYDHAGNVTLAGTTEDPTRRFLEHPADAESGRIKTTVVTADQGPLTLRIPGESRPARIVLFRTRFTLQPHSPTREPLGTFQLQP